MLWDNFKDFEPSPVIEFSIWIKESSWCPMKYKLLLVVSFFIYELLQFCSKYHCCFVTKKKLNDFFSCLKWRSNMFFIDTLCACCCSSRTSVLNAASGKCVVLSHFLQNHISHDLSVYTQSKNNYNHFSDCADAPDSYLIISWLISWSTIHHCHINPYSAGIDFSRQNLTSVDVRFWRLKSIPTL